MNDLVENTWEIELTSDCQCWSCTECGVGYVGAEDEQKCEECDKDLERADSCFGCWDDSESNFYDALEEWRKEVGVAWEKIRIKGVGMGWTSSSGEAVVDFDKALRALTINGDFRIEAKWQGKNFSARRWSHDEPMGSAHFEFLLVKYDEEEEG